MRGISFLVVLIILLQASIFVYAGRSMYVHTVCLEYGYPESEVAYTLKGYCISRDYKDKRKPVPLYVVKEAEVAEWAE